LRTEVLDGTLKIHKFLIEINSEIYVVNFRFESVYWF
jgi:hypothetical protein